MITNDNKKGIKKENKFYCENCDYICFKQYDWDRHTFTRKHQNGNKMVTNGNILDNNDTKRGKKGQKKDPTETKCEKNNICTKNINKKTLKITSMEEKKGKKGQKNDPTEMKDNKCNTLIKN